jgi:hypothetical protein
MISISPVSTTPSINLCHGFSVFARGNKFMAGDNDAGEQDTSMWGVYGRVFLWRFE